MTVAGGPLPKHRRKEMSCSLKTTMHTSQPSYGAHKFRTAASTCEVDSVSLGALFSGTQPAVSCLRPLSSATMNPVYLYVPNLIGYGRILAGIAAFFFTFTNHAAFLWLYTVSYTLDALDGIAARKLNQCASISA